MTVRFNGHEWINTCIAGIALLVAGAAAYFSWQANEMKRESLAMLASQTGECTTSFTPGITGATIGLCWKVTLANRSEDRLSLVDYRVAELKDNSMDFGWSGYQHLEGGDGKPLSLPINLDGGEAKQILVRAPTGVPLAVAQVIMNMPAYKEGSLTSLPLKQVEKAVAASGMDIAGNKRAPPTGLQLRNPLSLLSLESGRGTWFNLQLSYSDPLAGWDPPLP